MLKEGEKNVKITFDIIRKQVVEIVIKRFFKLRKEIQIASIAAIGALTIVSASTIANAREARIEAEHQAELKKQEQDRIKAEIEAEKNRKYIGVNKEGEKYSYDAKKVWEKLSKYDYSNDGKKMVFLTFDDGPSTTVTPQILDTLDKNGVKATFFITGDTLERGGDKAAELLKREFNSGNAIANHSYSHDYKKLYPGRTLNLEAFKEDFGKTDEMFKNILGKNFSTNVLRCPGGYMSWRGMDELKEYLVKEGKASIDWNALTKDAEGRKKNADELYQAAVKESEGKEMVVLLMHDTYGKDETAKALPRIIQYYKDNGYEFKTLV